MKRLIYVDFLEAGRTGGFLIGAALGERAGTSACLSTEGEPMLADVAAASCPNCCVSIFHHACAASELAWALGDSCFGSGTVVACLAAA